MWKFWKKYSLFITTIIIIVLGLLYINSCSNHNKEKKRLQNLINYNHTVKQYQANDNSTVDYNENINVTVKDLLITQDTLLNYIENLKLKVKNVQSSTIITEKLILDTLKIPIELTNCKFDTTILIDSFYYKMNIKLTNSSLTFNSIKFPNKQGITIAKKKEKWWKPEKTIVAITNTNPYIKTDGITSYNFNSNDKIISISPGIGYGLYYDLTNNNIGHGFTLSMNINFKLFNFKK